MTLHLSMFALIFVMSSKLMCMDFNAQESDVQTKVFASEFKEPSYWPNNQALAKTAMMLPVTIAAKLIKTSSDVTKKIEVALDIDNQEYTASPLHIAVIANDRDLLAKLSFAHSENNDVTIKDSVGETLLHKTMVWGRDCYGVFVALKLTMLNELLSHKDANKALAITNNDGLTLTQKILSVYSHLGMVNEQGTKNLMVQSAQFLFLKGVEHKSTTHMAMGLALMLGILSPEKLKQLAQEHS
jgi:hypothetical protein